MNIADILPNHAARRPDHPAIIDGGRIITHGEYETLVRQWAAHLRALGVREGDIVGINLKDTAEHLIALYAIPRLGAAILPMDWRWTVEEKSRIADYFGARLVLIEADDSFANERGSWTGAVVDNTWNRAVTAADPEQDFPEGGNPPLVLSLSSGTTGIPKGPLITHDQFFARFMIYFVTLGFNERSRYLCATPLYFGGTRGYSMCSLYTGGTVVLLPPPYDMADLVTTAREQKATHLFLVPTLLRRVLDLPPAPDGAPLMGGLDYLFSTGAVLHVEERDDLMRRVCPRYLNFYGSTDGGGATALMPDDPPEVAESVGRPVFGAFVETVDEDDKPLPPGEVGRIRYRHPGTATGYYNNPEASTEAFRGGWYYPGDLGWRDADGYLYLAGRAKDMIIRGGVNIYPAEIEHVLTTHPGVREAAVVGWPSHEFGEEVAAFVVPGGTGDGADEAALIAYCREKLARYKAPRAVFVVDDLPKSGVGKVLKAELTERLEPL